MVKRILHFYRLNHPNPYHKSNHILCDKKVGLNKYNCTLNPHEVNCALCFELIDENDVSNFNDLIFE